MKRAGLIAAAAFMFLMTGCDSNNSYSRSQNDYSYTPSTTTAKYPHIVRKFKFN